MIRERRLSFFLLCLLCLPAQPVSAETIQQEMPGQRIATAAYLPGDEDKPLLLFVHAFLQTREFPTTAHLAEALHEEGYPTLSPTLTLGISDRRNSLPCESLHLHSIDQEVEEIARWVDWAVARGFDSIRLIGHSAGSVSVLAYLDRYQIRLPKAVDHAVLISLTPYGIGQPVAYETAELEQQARNRLQQDENEPIPLALSFCKQYPTRPGDYLSYLEYTAKRVQRILDDSPVPIDLVLGDQDLRISPQWFERLKTRHARVHVIEDANHFFDQSHEFDLLDIIGEIIAAP